MGEVTVLSIMLDLNCNWRMTPTGTAVERAAIAQAVRLMAKAHPYAHA